MKVFSRLTIACALLAPALIFARKHSAFSFEGRSGLAKAAAVAPGDITGFWEMAISDDSDSGYIYNDTLQAWFGGDGKMEIRTATEEIDLEYPDEPTLYWMQQSGSWKIESGNIIVTWEKCTGWDPEEVLDCLDEDIEPETSSVADWTVSTVDGKKALTMPDPDGAEDPEIWYYVGASAAFTIASAPSAVRPSARFADSRNRKAALSVGRAFPGTGALDLRGRSLPAGRVGQGVYILRP